MFVTGKLSGKMVENVNEARSLELTPTWSVASVLTVFVAVSLLVERLIHRLSTVSPNSACTFSTSDKLYFLLYE